VGFDVLALRALRAWCWLPAWISRVLNRSRLRLLAQVASAQVLVQAVAFLAGIVLVRALPPTDYGHYTLAASLVGLVAVLCDLGLATAVLAVGGRHWRASTSQSASLQASMQASLLSGARVLHQRLAWCACACCLPWAVWVLLKQGGSVWQVVALSLLGVAGGVMNARNGISLSLLRLQGGASGAVALQQKMDLGLQTARLLVLLLLCFFLLPAMAWALTATTAMTVNLLMAVAYFIWLVRALPAVAPSSAPASASAPTTNLSPARHQAALRAHVRKQGPNALYYVFSSQAALWLIGVLGNAERVAEVGALARLAAVFALLGVVMATLAQPYFARQHGVAELRAAFVLTNAFFALLTAVLCALAWCWPSGLLWVLGPAYAQLKTALLWMVLSSTLTAWGATVYSLGSARGWVLPVGLAAPAGLLTLAIGAWQFDLATAAGVFMLNTATALVGLVLAVFYVAHQLRRYAHAHAHAHAQQAAQTGLAR
jgi:hypothetical protein